MASLNVSSNGPSISKSYQSVIDCTLPTGSATYGQWAVFSVSTPLISAFQRSSEYKESILKVQSTGAGELVNLLDEFSEGKIQFAFLKVTDPNSGLPKNVLIAWCGEGVPERTKGYFTSHLSAVSKSLSGYHVQITARSEGDLTPEGIVQKVGDASGANYAPQRGPLVAPDPRPVVSTQPAFTPARAGVMDLNMAPDVPKRVSSTESGYDDGWGPDAPPITRTELETVQPAYKPTTVNIQEIKSQEQSRMLHNDQRLVAESKDVIKGDYQPVGKVDIAAIRRQARETGELQEDRPEPVKGAYEPVGKVDIAAIRSRAQKQAEPSTTRGIGYSVSPDSKHQRRGQSNLVDNSKLSDPSERMTSLPKPKASIKIGVSSVFTGTKAPLPGEFVSKPAPPATQIGSASRTFADQGGKTPAQQWAERKARERGQNPTPQVTVASDALATVERQHSGKGDWKSSYTGKTWAPVQTTHTGKSVNSSISQQDSEDNREAETPSSRRSVNAIREQFIGGPSTNVSRNEKSVLIHDSDRNIPLPGAESADAAPEKPFEVETHHVPTPPQQPRSPTPPTPSPVHEVSPIRIALPVSREIASARDDQYSPPLVMPTHSLQQAVPNEGELEDAAIDIGRETAKATVVERAQGAPIRAIVQYDYEKAEDNEIDLNEGDYVSDIEMVDKDWWLGSNIRGERGLFPSNYVELVESGEENQADHLAPDVGTEEPKESAFIRSSDTIVATPSDKAPVATALYDYEAAEDNELSFPEGAEIVNVEFPDDDWWFGEYNGRKGLFPANYVQLGK